MARSWLRLSFSPDGPRESAGAEQLSLVAERTLDLQMAQMPRLSRTCCASGTAGSSS